MKIIERLKNIILFIGLGCLELISIVIDYLNSLIPSYGSIGRRVQVIKRWQEFKKDCPPVRWVDYPDLRTIKIKD